MFTYSVLEASEKLGISTRAVQKRCKKEDVRKKDNKYLITDLLLDKWFKELASNEPTNEPENGSQEIKGLREEIDIMKILNDLEFEEKYAPKIKEWETEIDLLKQELEDLKSYSKLIEEEGSYQIEDIQKLNLDEIENTDFKFQREGEFIKEGNFVFVPKDKVFAEYSELEYSEAEQKLQEWSTMQQTITTNEQVFDAKLSSANEIKDHYKSQFEYQKKQSEKMLDLHQRLIDNLHQRNFIEAKEKGFDKK